MTDVAVAGEPRLYRHSGKVPVGAIVGALVVSLVVAAVVGSALGGLQFLLELIAYLKTKSMLLLVLLLGAGLSLGIAPTYVLMKFKARSVPMAAIFAGLSVIVAYYFAWVAWFYARSVYLDFHVPYTVFLDPSRLYHLIEALYPRGWSKFVDPAAGVFLGMLWVAEFGTLIVMACVYAARQMNGKVFCESCGVWGTMRPLMSIKDRGSEETSALRKELGRGNIEALQAYAMAPVGEPKWLEVSLEGCSSCDNLQTLTVEQKWQVKTKDGTNTKKLKLLRRLMLTPEQTVGLAVTAAGLKTTTTTPTTTT